MFHGKQCDSCVGIYYLSAAGGRQTIHNLVNKLRPGLLIDNKQKHKRRVLTEEKSEDAGARLEHTPRKSLKRLAQETRVSKSNASRVTQLLKLRAYKTTLIRDPANRVHLCIWFLQPAVEGEIGPQMPGTAFSTPHVICEL
jgi:hypothetical protein